MSNLDGNNIIPIKYAQINIAGKYLYASQKDGTTSVFDNKGKETNMDSKTSKLSVADEKYEIIIKNDENQTTYSVVDKNGNSIIKPEYTYIEYLFDNYFIVCNRQGKLGILDDKENEKLELKYDSVQKIRDTNLIQTSIISENSLQVYSPKIEMIYEGKNAAIDEVNGYTKIYNDENTKYFDDSGKEAKSNEVFANNKLFAKSENGKWGFVDSNGNTKVDAIYEKVTEFNQYGFAGIKQDGKWGVIDEQGKVILKPKYEFDNKIEPDFIGKFYKTTYGFGEVYYTDK